MYVSFVDPELRCQDMQAGSIYEHLMQGVDPETPDGFDHHVAACIFALATAESVSGGRPLTATTGLDPADLAVAVDTWFPNAPDLRSDEPVERSADEACLLDLLTQCATDGSPMQIRLAAMIARRAQSANHLWQDLGLRDRRDLSRLMMRHFKPLAARNTTDMKWKKFLYRMICRDAGYSLCTAPSCSECCDFDACFGDESGESRLARTRLAISIASAS